jgi:hypothetical protein
MASHLLPDNHPMRHHDLSMTQVEAILKADGMAAVTSMAVGSTQRELVALSLLLKG